MITARAQGENGEQIIVLGITRGNVERLVGGQPIRVTPETHPGLPEGFVIMIFYGETERVCANVLKSLITAETKIIAVPRDPSGQVS